MPETDRGVLLWGVELSLLGLLFFAVAFAFGLSRGALRSRSGMALNGELAALDGRLIEATRTAPDYKLYALKTTPPKPGMLRVEAGKGAAIELEIWSLSSSAFGKFVNAIPAPMAIGTIRLADGRSVKGFLVEPEALGDARDITVYGGWRAYMADAATART